MVWGLVLVAEVVQGPVMSVASRSTAFAAPLQSDSAAADGNRGELELADGEPAAGCW